MRHTDLYSGSARLRSALIDLRAKWIQIEPYWQDVVRQEFEQNYLEPIDRQTLGLVEAVGRLAEIVLRAEHECS